VPLDPVACFRFSFTIPAQSAAKVIEICELSQKLEDEQYTLERYNNWDAFIQALNMAQSRAKFEEKYLDVSVEVQGEAMENLEFAIRRFGQPLLWKLGISGDLPIFAHVVESEDMGRVKELLDMHRFLRFKGIRVDLVLVCRVEADYIQPISTALGDIVRKENVGGNVHVLAGLAEWEIEQVKKAGRII
jgi:cellobiose phosphorylase